MHTNPCSLRSELSQQLSKHSKPCMEHRDNSYSNAICHQPGLVVHSPASEFLHILPCLTFYLYVTVLQARKSSLMFFCQFYKSRIRLWKHSEHWQEAMRKRILNTQYYATICNDYYLDISSSSCLGFKDFDDRISGSLITMIASTGMCFHMPNS